MASLSVCADCYSAGPEGGRDTAHGARLAARCGCDVTAQLEGAPSTRCNADDVARNRPCRPHWVMQPTVWQRTPPATRPSGRHVRHAPGIVWAPGSPQRPRTHPPASHGRHGAKLHPNPFRHDDAAQRRQPGWVCCIHIIHTYIASSSQDLCPMATFACESRRTA